MKPRIESGQLCTVAPVTGAALAVGDIVLCRVHGTEYLHFIKAIDGGGVTIGNNRGGINGCIPTTAVFGRLVKVEA